MKPIEPGCKALIVRANISSNVGKCVHVIREVKASEYLQEIDAYAPNDGWFVSGDIISLCGEKGFASCRHGWLIRIDGDWDGKREELEEENKVGCVSY